MKLYNTLTRKKALLKTIKTGQASFYACGPTVYDFAHIGNFRTFVFEDLLRRALERTGLTVNHVMNITDVDDKTINGSRKTGVSLKEYTRKFEHAFFEDLDVLGVKRPDKTPRATEHVSQMIALIEKLLAKGVAYKGADGSVYYSISKFKPYGKLSGLKLDELKAGARVANDNYDKETASDFALWKAYDSADGDVYWQAPFGKGRPGWHVECSAMSIAYLGESFDLHAGGVDLIFPHHENEIAQSEAATGKPFAHTWAHCEHLVVDGRKMSKSLGNFYTLRDVLAKGYSPAAVRWLLLSAHYRSKLNFTFEGLKAAQESVKRLSTLREQLLDLTKTGSAEQAKEVQAICVKSVKAFDAALYDDLNTPLAIAAVFDFVTNVNKLILQGKLSKEGAESALSQLEDFDSILGVLTLVGEKTVDTQLSKWVEEKIAQRQTARATKDFAKADEIRKQLEAKGIVLEDTPKGVKWKLA